MHNPAAGMHTEYILFSYQKKTKVQKKTSLIGIK